MGKSNKLTEKGEVAKNTVHKFSKINLINSNMTRPHITVNGDGIADSASKLHCYRRGTPTENDRLAAVLHAMHPDGYQIVSTVQADMKVYTFKKEARRRYKFPAPTQNLVSFPVISDNVCTITLYITSIKITKSGQHVMEGCREKQTRLWRLKLEDAQKEEYKHHLCI